MLRQYIRKQVRAEADLSRRASGRRHAQLTSRMTAAPSILFVILPLMLLFYATVSIGTNVLRSTLSLETGAALAISFVVTVIALMIFGVRIMILRGAEKSALVARRRAER